MSSVRAIAAATTTVTTTSMDVTLKAPKLKGISFEAAIIERYRRREISAKEALIEMVAGRHIRLRVEDITEALRGGAQQGVSFHHQ